MSNLPAGYELTDDQARIDAVAAHANLARSYWSPGIAQETVSRAIANSWCVAVRFGGQQVGFARLITDRATFAWLADVYVLEEHQAKGLAQAMVLHFQLHPELQDLRRWGLGTLDAHSLYSRLGWTALSEPQRFMERYFPEAGR